MSKKESNLLILRSSCRAGKMGQRKELTVQTLQISYLLHFEHAGSSLMKSNSSGGLQCANR